MGKRFSRIKWAKNEGLTGEVITKYKAFHDGTATYTVTQTPKGASIQKAVNPFGIQKPTAPATKTYRVYLSGNANSNLANVGLDALDLGWSDDYDVADSNYSPAMAVIALPSTKPAEQKTSQITGLSYRRTYFSTYSFPFGQTATNNYEYEAQNLIIDKVQEKSSAIRFTFKPEAFSRMR